ncbi:hypothetical protein D9757_009820 [Collybiopsis confluens]|uniref:NACHT domain-containing protein n=1 Tax=Collybiopsis confluens TaxID=2823264 RepID=A0A8H5HFF6_9AGAR|nr:hypothetical protein D9757_009820 [Collybiopsis confluens]
MAEQKRSQSQPSRPRGRKKEKVLGLFKKKDHSRSPAPSAKSEVTSHPPGTPDSSQTRGRVLDRFLNIFNPNRQGSRSPGPSIGPEVQSDPAIPVGLLQAHNEQVAGNQNQQDVPDQAPTIRAPDAEFYHGPVGSRTEPEVASPSENQNQQDTQHQASIRAPDAEFYHGLVVLSTGPEVASPSTTAVETVGSEMDNNPQGHVSSTANEALSPVENIAPATRDQTSGKSVISQIGKLSLAVWQGLHHVTEVIEPLLDGTPFKAPVTVFNTISSAVETSIDNEAKMKEVFNDVTDYLKMIDNALLRGNIRKIQCHSFLKFLVMQSAAIHALQAKGAINKAINAHDIVTQLGTLKTGLGSESQKFQIKETFKLADSASYNAELGPTTVCESCTPGTRDNILDQLKDWISDNTSSPIFWIRGMAGTGKSTIAKTICEYYSYKVGNCQLGASFFCSRQDPKLRNQRNVFPTLAYQLSKKSDAFWSALAGVDEGTVYDLPKHATNILLEPWKTQKESYEDISSWLIVIDALDELEGSGGFNVIKQLLKGITPDILGLKILITSRPDQDIASICGQELSNDAICRLEDVKVDEMSKAIATHLRYQLPFLDEMLLHQAVERCAGLFIYAATLVRQVSDGHGSKVKMTDNAKIKKMTQLLNGGALSNMFGINALYRDIVEDVLGFRDGENHKKYQTLLRIIMCMRNPIPIVHLAGLLKENEQLGVEREEIENIVNALHAVVFIGTDDCIYIYHKSFYDFFEKEDLEPCEIILAESCLKIILKSLHFNMCKLPSSYLLDSEVVGLKRKVQEVFGNEVEYAVCFGILHIIQVPEGGQNQILILLGEFEREKILFWIEAMNVLKKRQECWERIKDLQRWIVKCQGAGSHILILSETEKLVKSFTQTPTSLSTPHLYISSLAIELETTGSSAGWGKMFRNIPKVKCRGVSNHGGVMLKIKAAAAIRTVAFSPDGLKFVSGSENGAVHIWDAVAGQQLAQLDGHTDEVSSVAFSPDGSRIVSGSHDCTVRIWDAVAGQQLAKLDGHTNDVNSVAFSPDGSRIVSGSHDETVCIWDAVAGQQLAQLDGHSGWVASVAFSPDGSKIVSGSADETVHIWDAVAGQQLAQLAGHTNWVISVAFSPDGSKIVSGSYDKTVQIWDAVAGQPLAQLSWHRERVSSVAFSPDGSKIVSGSYDKTVRIWDAVAGQQLAQLDGHANWVTSVAFSPDGSKIVSGSYDKTVQIWDAVAGQLLAQLDGHRDWINSVAFSPDGSKIVSGSYDRTVRIWDAVAGQQLAELHGHTDVVSSAAFSPNGCQIVSGSYDCTVHIWDAVVGHQLAKLHGHTSWVSSVAFSPDGSKIVSGSYDQTVRIWDAVAGQQVAQLDGHTERVGSVAFSPDGSKIVSGSHGETVFIWDAVAGQQLAKLHGHTSWVSSVAFSPDGSKIVSGSYDQTVRIWDAVAGQQLAQLDGHTKWVTSVAFSPDGSKIVSGSYDCTVCIWDAVAGQQLAQSYNLPGHPQNHLTNGSPTRVRWHVDPQQWLCLPSFPSERLMWMPPPLMSSLLPPFCLLSISHHPSTLVSLDKSFLGPNWSKCYTPSAGDVKMDGQNE